MGILDKVRGFFKNVPRLLKREKSEEEKLLVDFGQAIKELKKVLRIINYASFGVSLDSVLKKDALENVKQAIRWLKEALRRVPLLEKLAHQVEVQDQNYRGQLLKEERTLLKWIGRLDNDLNSDIKQSLVFMEGIKVSIAKKYSCLLSNEKDRDKNILGELVAGLEAQKKTVESLLALHKRTMKEAT